MLEVENLHIVYDDTVEAVRNASLSVSQGSITALLGSNGAGKSTILKSISGVLYPEYGKVRDGRITFCDKDITSHFPDQIVKMGLMQVPEGRQLFDELTVAENLTMGGFTVSTAMAEQRRKEVYSLLPRLEEKKNVIAGYLSGGEQQMAAIGRALMARPQFLMLDEPSLGLAPKIISEIYQAIRDVVAREGLTVLLVEQNATLAFEFSKYGYILENGRVVLDGPADELKNNEDVKEFYLGLGEAGQRRSMRDIKHYRRRKRWLS